MRHFRDSLEAKKYDYNWSELPEGHSWGLWRANIDFMLEYIFPFVPTGINEGSNIPPDKFELYQNYPNPFNPETVIGYQLSVNSKVSLKVFDILGKEVQTLVNEEKPAGAYKVEFNSGQRSTNNKLTSGIYLYQLRAGSVEGGFVQTKKMVVLR
ncbi:MAG: hypothetical protein COW85_06485 [Ignavibacteria bacterium CG22_combo_CG10-13_8_21_14_all_37_15]|nr:T9SS type A sorting domain-containing protein [Ignavibacteria bacterium]NCS82323.1 T9SS type A sorting domain-containing protein [Ignavibacteria bacterium]PIP77922.1 MAG: hypothetical protein COW85_06485 [Ignavibacteria bacterium CG22_combo_CG10-13_8_21_14_all_37_15]